MNNGVYVFTVSLVQHNPGDSPVNWHRLHFWFCVYTWFKVKLWPVILCKLLLCWDDEKGGGRHCLVEQTIGSQTVKWMAFSVDTHVINALRCLTEEFGKGDQGGLWGERRDGFRLQRHEYLHKPMTTQRKYSGRKINREDSQGRGSKQKQRGQGEWGREKERS